MYLARTRFILCNNNTNVPGSSCSQHSGFASVEGNKERPWILFTYVDVMFAVFIYFKKEEYHIHFVLHSQHELFPESSTAGWDVSSEHGCLSVWRATHAIHFHMAPQIMWPCWEPGEIKLRVLIIFFNVLVLWNLFCYYPLAFHHPFKHPGKE